MLDRYGLKTCIFIPGWIVERYPALCEEVLRRGHEVGHHGYLHEKPFFMKSREEEEELLVKSLDIFRKILGVEPLGSRSPSADPSHHTMALLKQHGFLYHSNALDTDLPYCHDTPHGPLVEFPTAWCNNDAPFFMFSAVPPVGHGIWSQEDVWEIWSEEFEGMYAEGGFFNWLGHPQIIGRPSRMRMVERLIQRVLGKKDVWWPSPVDLARFWLEQAPARHARLMAGGRLEGRVALVTGASRGFGRAIALAFAREGARLAANYFASEREGKEVAAEAARLGVEAIALRGDVSQEEDARALVKGTLDRFGRLDILVNNAGIMVRGPLLEVPADGYGACWRSTCPAPCGAAATRCPP